MTTRRKNKASRNRPTEFHLLSIFPHIFDSYFSESLFKRAVSKDIIRIKTHDLRRWSKDRHKKVDDRPFGGGPGMVLKVGPIYRAVRHIFKNDNRLKTAKHTRVILFSTRGTRFNSKTAKKLAKYDRLVFICGRYEGVDERVAKHIADEEISIGDFVLSGGELPAMVVMEAVSRFIPGFLGKEESLEDIKGSYPAYTRPEEFVADNKKNTWKVPEVLLSGNHEKIKKWRNQN